jgi:hypothetical protein
VRPTEKVARDLLGEATGKLRFDIEDETEARRALAERYAGHALQDVMEIRREMIEKETIRVESVVRHLLRPVIEALDDRPEDRAHLASLLERGP